MTGDVFINGYDAYTRWGINLEDGALSALLTPAPIKEFVQNKSRLNNGKTVIDTNSRYDERELTLPFHLLASSRSQFLSRYAQFCDEVLSNGSFTLSTRYQSNVVYRLIYVSCTQFRQFNIDMAVFSLKVVEPDPSNRTSPTPVIQV